MRSPEQEIPGARHRRMRWVDLGAASLIFVLGVAWLADTNHIPGVTRHLSALGVTLVAAQALPLVLRRRAPLVVLVAVLTGAVLYAGFSFPPSPVDLAELVALYTLGAHSQTRTVAVGSAVSLVALGVIWRLRPEWQGVIEFLAVSLVFGFAIAAGRHQRTRLQLIRREIQREAELGQARADQAAAEARVGIARDLHDSVGHELTVALFHAGVARMKFDADPAGARRALGVAEDSTRATLEEMQVLVESLRNNTGEPPLPTLAEVGVLVSNAGGVGLEVTLTREGEVRPLPSPIEVTGYRIVQEALTNVVRHSQAARVHVELRYRDQELRIQVRDDGLGQATTKGGGGKGLIGLAERAAAVGGRLEAGPGDAGGFAVSAWLPTPAASGHADRAVARGDATGRAATMAEVIHDRAS